MTVSDLPTLGLRSKVNTHAQMNFFFKLQYWESITKGKSKDGGLIVMEDNIFYIDDVLYFLHKTILIMLKVC